MAIKSDKIYTYTDYLSWPEDERWEIIDGVAYAMTSPNRQHQEISGNLYLEFGNYLRNKSCRVYAAPFDVRLSKKNETPKDVSTIVQPDITVVCDQNKLDNKGCLGAPDLVVEILSPSTASHDVIRKRRLYEAKGVLEYWIVDPTHHILTRLYLNEELVKYREPEYFSKEDTITPVIFPELQIDLNNIFPEHIEE